VSGLAHFLRRQPLSFLNTASQTQWVRSHWPRLPESDHDNAQFRRWDSALSFPKRRDLNGVFVAELNQQIDGLGSRPSPQDCARRWPDYSDPVTGKRLMIGMQNDFKSI
jgi:hypothetical protein